MKVAPRRLVLLLLAVLAAGWAYWWRSSRPASTADRPLQIILADPVVPQPSASEAPLEETAPGSRPTHTSPLPAKKAPVCDPNDAMCGGL